MPLWAPKPEWQGQDAILIGGGSSLKSFDFSFLTGRNVIGANDAFRLGPGIVKICIFGDSTWWEKNKWELESFTGKAVTCSTTLLPLQCPWLLQMKRVRDGLYHGDTIGWNYSTGAAAINLAVSLGAARIFLLGYDLGGIDGKTHWHKHSFKRIPPESYKRFARGFSTLAQALRCIKPDVKVFTVTEGESQLQSFPRITRAEFFNKLEGKE